MLVHNSCSAPRENTNPPNLNSFVIRSLSLHHPYPFAIALIRCWHLSDHSLLFRLWHKKLITTVLRVLTHTTDSRSPCSYSSLFPSSLELLCGGEKGRMTSPA